MDVKKHRELAKITQQELADATGIPRDRISKWEQGKGSPKALDYNTLKDFFISKGAWEIVPDTSQTGSDELPSIDFMKGRRDKKNVDSGPFMVPFVPIKAQAGYKQKYLNESFIKELERFPILPGIDPRGYEWRYFEVVGDSMESELKEGDFILCSLVPQIDWDNIRNYYVHVIVTEDEILIKRIYKKSASKWVLISDNEQVEQELLQVEKVKELWVFRSHVKKRVPVPRRFEIKI